MFHTPITTKHSAGQLVHHPSTLHIANHQATPSLSACHTHQSITLLPQLSFILFNVFFIVIILLTIERLRGCDGMHHLFAPIINTLCVCATFAPSSVAIILLWCFGCCACCSSRRCVSHTHTTFGQWMLLSGTHMASHRPHAIHFTNHSALLLVSKRLPVMDSTSQPFGESPMHTQVQSIIHHHQSALQHLTTYHMDYYSK